MAASIIPPLRIHKPTKQAYLILNGRRVYIGRHDLPDTERKYHRLIAEWLSNGMRRPVPTEDISIAELCDRYFEHAKVYYQRPDGAPSGSLLNVTFALRPLLALYEDTKAAECGPLALRAVRDTWIRDGLRLTTVNKRVGVIKRLFRFGVSHELIPPPDVLTALNAVEGLHSKVVAPLAAHRPVLFLVMDGMSVAVFNQLIDDNIGREWTLLKMGSHGAPLAGIATLPSVTEYSRTSLLCGELKNGDACTEQAGFSQHRALLATCKAGRPPVLFHKSALHGIGEGGLLPVRVADQAPQADELALSGHRVVLDSHQVLVPWRETVRYAIKKNGYHGGANPQEMIVPLAVLSSGGELPQGWVETTHVEPPWWSAPRRRECVPYSRRLRDCRDQRTGTRGGRGRPRPRDSN